MTSSVVLITGATDGIGKETARQLLARGATVLCHGRTLAKAQAVCHELGGDSQPVAAELSSLEAVRELGTQVRAAHPRLDVLINNAGVFVHERRRSADGFELTLAVNHLAPFMLTHLLLPALQKSGAGRIINVSSVAHARGHIDLDDLQRERGYEGYAAYAGSKLANLLFTYELARRLGPDSPVTVNALHPGVISTKLLRGGFGMGGASIESGAATSVRLATDPALSRVTGRYFVDGREAPSSPRSHDPALMARLFDLSGTCVGLLPLPPL